MLYEQIQEALTYIRKQTGMTPRVGIVLGTGLSQLAQDIESEVSIDYGQIPHFPVSTVQSHAGKLIFGKLAGVEVVAMAGRFHYYEGYTMQQVTFPIRVFKALGVELVILSNAAGSTNADIEAGDLVFIRDHINIQPENPLRGPNDERLGPRFPDMLHTYDRDLIWKALDLARQHDIRAHSGVYLALQGPNLETPAEYQFMQRIGADVVGMSTVPEVLVARHSGMRVFAVSVVSNKCFPLEEIKETSVDDVIAMVQKSESKVREVVKGLLGGRDGSFTK
ncbi:MAG: purine-nucleoside phosphorylase [Saprospirales bacterium]|nr:purine-nucleoside phosphorylase [Saprospirales bacterium]MBK8493157.1 purine-nucleoside phosphorylase [Saprospirales bacterium]